jgi:hypothetical protein
MRMKPRKVNAMTKYIHEQSGAEVEGELYRWVAIYEDGTTLQQFDDADGKFHQFGEIDQSKLHVFQMVGEGKTYTIVFDPSSMKLIHKYRHITLNALTEDEVNMKWYLFGYEKKVGGHNEKTLMVLTHTGELVITDNDANLTVES